MVLSRVFALTALGAVAALSGCTTYDFTPTTPTAVAVKGDSHIVAANALHPDIMMLVDRSGSMNSKDGTKASRLQQVQSTMHSFLGANPDVARFGVVAFSSLSGGGACNPAKVADIAQYGSDIPATDDPGTLDAASQKVDAVIGKLDTGGSTPTAASLLALASYPELANPAQPNRDRFVILLTDGEPNCNANNPNNQCTAPNALCQCTSNDCDPGKSGCSTSCLDEDASVQAVSTLASAGIQTIVIGFGADAEGSAAGETLNAMARAGGFGRQCPNGTDAECNVSDTGETCGADHTCSKAFYQAATGTELASALNAILGRLPHPCSWALSVIPADPAFLSVEVNGVDIAAGAATWSYSNGIVTFAQNGAVCKELSDSSTATAVTLEFRVMNPI